MAKTMEVSSAQLKGKLNHVKNLLESANKRLQDEAGKYEIFTTKTSASIGGTGPTNGKQNSGNGVGGHHEIVNVTDSLDKLSEHLNLRPSIGPMDINIDSDGELILAPLMEPTTLNNLINGRLDEFANQSQSNSPQISSNAQDFMRHNLDGNLTGNGIASPNGASMMDNNQCQQMRTSKQQSNVRQVAGSGYNQQQQQQHQHQQQHQQQQQQQQQHQQQQDENNPRMAANASNYNNSPNHEDSLVDQQPNSFNSNSSAGMSPIQQRQDFNNEKLVANGTDANHVNGNRRRRSSQTSKVQSVAAVFENHIAESSENRRLYKANGNFTLNHTDGGAKSRSFEGAGRPLVASTNSNSNNDTSELPGEEPMQTLGYTNDMYKTTHELTGSQAIDAVDYKKLAQSDSSAGGNNAAYANNLLAKSQNDANVGKRAHHQNQRVSPSTSAGSTVPLADECDSGTSSFRSQAAKGTLYSPQSHKPIPQLDEDPRQDSSLDQELIEKLSPDMERIKVTLEKDSSGLGITIAGYICEREEISGIFIKSITPGSPADKSGKIRILDQIFAVNGQEILGYSNAEAVNVLRSHTSRVVTLELMRYLAESKYRKLQKLLNRAEPTSSVQSKVPETDLEQPISIGGVIQEAASSNINSGGGARATGAATDLIKAQPGFGAASPRQSSLAAAPVDGGNSEQMPVQAQAPIESMYNNTSAFYATSAPLQVEMPRYSEYNVISSAGENQTPIAAQRGAATNKIIETKQGARNTIDIRSPMCQTTTAPHLNEISDMLVTSSAANGAAANRSIVDRQKQQAAEEFGQLVRTEKLEWEHDVQIVELYRDSSQSLGFTVKDYVNPKDTQQSIFMIVLITPGGIAERDGRLSVGDLLVFVDDTNLEGASPNEAVRALRRTSGQVRLGVLKYKRTDRQC